MIEVGVGDEDRLDALDAQALDRGEKLVRLVARIDDHGGGIVLAADDVAVLLHRADREHADVERAHLRPGGG